MKVCIVALLLFCTVSLCSAQGSCPDPTFYIDTLPGPELVRNGNFESLATYFWNPSDEEGFNLVPYVAGACNTFAAGIDTFYTRGACSRPNAGLYQQVKIGQTEPKRIFVSAYAMGKNVSGVPDVNFSLYLDVWFTDGTIRYGVVAPIPFTTPGWNRVNLTLDESKPIDYIFVNLVFRNHTGTDYFYLVSVKEEVILDYPNGQNILTDPSFEDCGLGSWAQSGGATCQVQSCGNDRARTGTGSLSTGRYSNEATCFTQIFQINHFNPPLTRTITFSAYVSINYALNAQSFDMVNLSIDDGHFAINVTNIPFEPTNGFVLYEVSLTPSAPITTVRVQLLLQGKPGGVVYDDASLTLS
jgi:hypothetical protein